jgi:hypothetical protein
MPLDRGAKRDRISSPPGKLSLSVDEGNNPYGAKEKASRGI